MAQNVYCIYRSHKKRGKMRTFICICLCMSKETQEGCYNHRMTSTELTWEI